MKKKRPMKRVPKRIMEQRTSNRTTPHAFWHKPVNPITMWYDFGKNRKTRIN